MNRKTFRFFIGSVAFAAGACFFASCNSAGPVFELAKDGVPCAVIVTPEKPNGVEKYAAEELKYHLDKAFGEEFKVVGEDNADVSNTVYRIYLGATKAAATAGLPGRPTIGISNSDAKVCAPDRVPSPPITTKASIPSLRIFSYAILRPSAVRNSLLRAVLSIVPPCWMMLLTLCDLNSFISPVIKPW